MASGGPTVRLTFAGDSTDLERSMGRVGAAAGEMERTFSAKSLAMTAAGGAAGMALASAFTASLDAEAGRAKMAAQMNLSAEDAKIAGDVAGRIYSAAWGESLEQVNEAVKGVVQNMGVEMSSVDLEPLAQQAAILSDVFGIDVVESTRAAGNLMRNLGTEGGVALDLIARVTQNGGARAADLLDTLEEYPVQFQKLGLSGETAMGIIDQGLKGNARNTDIVGDALKEFSIRAVDGSAAAAESFKALGLDADEMVRVFAKGGPEAAAALDTVFDRLRETQGTADAATIAFGLFGTQSEDLGSALYSIDPSAATASLGEFQGAVESAGATAADTAQSKITELQRGFEGMLMSVVGIEGPLGTVAAGVVGLGGDAISMAGSVGMAAMALRGLGIGSAIATAAQWAFNAALSANPIGLVVLALAALVAGLVWAYNNVGWFKDMVDAAGRGIVAAFEWTVGMVGSAISWFGQLPGMVGGWFMSMANAAISRGVALVNWVRGLPGMIGAAVGNLGRMLVSAGGDLLSGLWAGITGAAGWLRSKVLGFFGSILPGWVKNILGIASPSKVFAALGKHIPSGMAVGIEGNLGVVSAAAMKMAAAAADPFAKATAFARDLAAARASGATIFEDYSWRGMSKGYDDNTRYQVGGAMQNGTLRFAGNTDSAVGTLIMGLVRSGHIQLT